MSSLDIVEIKSFDDVLAENVELAKKVLGDKWIPLEADIYMKHLRVLTYRGIINQASKNEVIKQLLISTATNNNLDVLGYNRGVERLQGSKPYATFRFSIKNISTSDLEIPKDTRLNDDSDRYNSYILEDGVILAGELFVDIKVELDLYLKSTTIQTTNIITTLPFQVEITQLELFENGNALENDEDYRLRIINSWAKYSTAGSEDSYRYYTLSADSRIDDVMILSDKPCEVDIYLASFDNNIDEVMIDRVNDVLSPKDVRPLSDKVNIYPAIKIEITLKATIYILDLLKADEIKQNILSNFKDSFFIGQDLPHSAIIRKMHLDGVYKVDLDNPQNYTISNKEIIDLIDIDLDFVGVENEYPTI